MWVHHKQLDATHWTPKEVLLWGSLLVYYLPVTPKLCTVDTRRIDGTYPKGSANKHPVNGFVNLLLFLKYLVQISIESVNLFTTVNEFMKLWCHNIFCQSTKCESTVIRMLGYAEFCWSQDDVLIFELLGATAIRHSVLMANVPIRFNWLYLMSNVHIGYFHFCSVQ